MDNNKSHSQAEGDWRLQLQPDTRHRTINTLMECLKRHLPFSGEEGLLELNKIAVRFEQNICSAALSESDYLRKISLKMLTMETKAHNSVHNYPSGSRPAESELVTRAQKRMDHKFSVIEGLHMIKQGGGNPDVPARETQPSIASNAAKSSKAPQKSKAKRVRMAEGQKRRKGVEPSVHPELSECSPPLGLGVSEDAPPLRCCDSSNDDLNEIPNDDRSLLNVEEGERVPSPEVGRCELSGVLSTKCGSWVGFDAMLPYDNGLAGSVSHKRLREMISHNYYQGGALIREVISRMDQSCEELQRYKKKCGEINCEHEALLVKYKTVVEKEKETSKALLQREEELVAACLGLAIERIHAEV